MQKNIEPCYYSEYLRLDRLLDAQHPVSGNYGNEAHDETLFIIVHQAYELWFKQILRELDVVLKAFAKPKMAEREMRHIIALLERIHTIQEVMIEQVNVLETMTSLDFLDFRDYLIPASGFQSTQFKQIEILLGLKSDQRINFDRESFYSRLNQTDREFLLNLEEQPSLFDHLDKWLERMPFTRFENFDFLRDYEQAVLNMLESDRGLIESADYLPPAERQFQLNELDKTKTTFEAVFDAHTYQSLQADGLFRLSHRSFLNSIFIHLYRDEPMLHLPFQLLNGLVTVDELFTTWRYRHVIMVQRMLGSKIGTGGSSGQEYLRRTTETNRFFKDLTALSTFLIPRSSLPQLPDEVKKALGFYINQKGADTQ